jgi:hypothetical protein
MAVRFPTIFAVRTFQINKTVRDAQVIDLSGCLKFCIHTVGLGRRAKKKKKNPTKPSTKSYVSDYSLYQTKLTALILKKDFFFFSLIRKDYFKK